MYKQDVVSKVKYLAYLVLVFEQELHVIFENYFFKSEQKVQIYGYKRHNNIIIEKNRKIIEKTPGPPAENNYILF